MTSAFLGLLAAWAAIQPAVPPPPIPASWELAWSAPAGCPDAEAIREQVAALVPAPGAGVGVLHVEATVVPRDDAFVLTLRTAFLERHDEREIRAKACGELAEAVSLVVAISLDPSLAAASPAVPEPDVVDAPAESAGSPRTSSPPSAPPELDAADPSTAAPSSPTLRADARPARARPPREWLLRLAPKLEVGTLPAFGGGLDLAVGVLWRWWRLELHGSHSWPRRVSGPEGSGGRFQLGAVGVRGCGRPRIGPVELPVCVGLDAGALRVDSQGLRPAKTVHGPWLAPSVGVGLAAGGPRVRFWTLVEGSVNVIWSHILVGEQSFHRQFPVSGRWLAGLELAFAIESR